MSLNLRTKEIRQCIFQRLKIVFHGKSVKTISRITGISRDRIYAFRYGTALPRADEIAKIVLFYTSGGTPINGHWLLTGEGQQSYQHN